MTGGGVIHDMRCDGTEENGVHDVMAIDFTTRIDVVATYEDGVHVLRPVGLPIEVTRRLDGDEMVWDYVGLHRACDVSTESRGNQLARPNRERPIRVYWSMTMQRRKPAALAGLAALAVVIAGTSTTLAGSAVGVSAKWTITPHRKASVSDSLLGVLGARPRTTCFAVGSRVLGLTAVRNAADPSSNTGAATTDACCPAPILPTPSTSCHVWSTARAPRVASRSGALRRRTPGRRRWPSTGRQQWRMLRSLNPRPVVGIPQRNAIRAPCDNDCFAVGSHQRPRGPDRTLERFPLGKDARRRTPEAVRPP